MALNERQKQKKRRQRALKRKKTSASRQPSPGMLSVNSVAQKYSRYPVHEVIYPDFLWGQGMGNLFFSRRHADGLIGVSIFMVDMYCLGVKDAFFSEVDEAEYRGMKQSMFEDAGGMAETMDPACMRKLVEQAVGYARELGFEPHKDYMAACRIFGDVDVGSCSQGFEFGKDGKPFYIAGPNDSPAVVRRIIQQLERRCDVDGYDFMTPFDF